MKEQYRKIVGIVVGLSILVPIVLSIAQGYAGFLLLWLIIPLIILLLFLIAWGIMCFLSWIYTGDGFKWADKVFEEIMNNIPDE